MPRFKNTFCSQCGIDLGPGEHGASSCVEHDVGIMTEEEIKLRLDKGEHPVPLCIEKYERIIFHLEKGGYIGFIDIGSGTCALCFKYLGEDIPEACPLYEHQEGVCGEPHTVYNAVWDAWEGGDEEDLIHWCGEMIKLLKEILPQERGDLICP
jgi:hypothetical protein